MHEIQVDVIGVERLQRGSDSLLDALVPWVVQFGGQPDLTSRHTGIFDSLANLCLIAVGESTEALIRQYDAHSN